MRIKLFENFDENGIEELLNNVKDCFNDFLDLKEESIDIFIEDETVILIFIILTNHYTESFSDFFDFKKSEFEKLNNINISLERLRKVHSEDFNVIFESVIGLHNEYKINLYIEPISNLSE